MQDVVGVGAGPTGMNLWSLVREPGVTLNAFDEVFPRILLGNRYNVCSSQKVQNRPRGSA